MVATILEVALGVLLIYILLSLIVSGLRELIAQMLNGRAALLRKGIAALLSEPTPGRLTAAFYEHPLIRALMNNDALPPYIPSESFTLAVFDLLINGTESTASTPIRSLDTLLQAVAEPSNTLIPDGLRRQLRLLFDLADSIEMARLAVETWFNNTMTRVSDWYKRRTQLWLAVLALLLVVIANADTLMLVNTLSQNAAVRGILSAAAESLAVQPAPAVAAPREAETVEAQVQRVQALADQLGQFNILGWCFETCAAGDPRAVPADQGGWLLKVIGWLLTALAATLGAPFWFDLLRRLVGIRAVVAPPEPGTALTGAAEGGGER